MEPCHDAKKQRCRYPFRSLIWFTVFFSITTLFSEAMKQYITSQITSLEKQFALSSTRSSVLIASDDIGYLVFILALGYFGRHGHIPRILGMTIVILGCAGVLCGVSYFFSPDTLPTGDESIKSNVINQGSVCKAGSPAGNMTCEDDGSVYGRGKSNDWILWFMTAMLIIQGVTQSARYTLGAPFIEDNADSMSQSTLLIGIVVVVNYLGAPVALGLGSVFSNMPLDLKETKLHPRHPQWIGAWWLGYLVLGILSLLSAPPLFFYPRTLLHRQSSDKEASNKADQTLKQKIIGIPKCICRLLRNPIFILLLFGNCLLSLFLAGTLAFDPKYTEVQFMIPAYEANYLVGVIGLVALILGTLGGAIITSKRNMTNQECLKFIAISVTLGSTLYISLLWFGCENPDIEGLGELGLNSSLSADCSCDVTEYFPLCGENGTTYKSPCFAGCTNKTETTYSSCEGVVGGVGVAGLCPKDCGYLYYYVVVKTVAGVIGAFPVVAIFMIILRCVDDDDKAMAMALMSFLSGLAGFLPAPILFGAVIDSTCKIWGKSCKGRGACTLYDLPLLRIRMKGLDIGLQLAALVLYIVAYLLYKLKVVKNNDTSKRDHAMAMSAM